MKHTIRTGRNIIAVLLAVLLTVLTASVAAVAEDTDVLVQFVNEYATGSIDEGTSLTNYKTEVLKSYSLAAGSTVALETAGAPVGATVYDGETPTRRKDASFGEYTFAGWVDGEGNAVEFPFVANQDATFYASFTGVEIECEIDFRCDGVALDAEGNLQPEIITVPVKDPETGEVMKDALDGHVITENIVNPAAHVFYTVPYGGSAADKKPSNDPVRQEIDPHYNSVFQGWDYDLEHIYKSGSINAVFKMVGKTYTFEFCDYDGTSLGKREIVYGEACTDVPEVAHRSFGTNTSNYYFDDEWNTVQDGLQTGLGESINMNEILFSYAEPDPKTKEIKVYAQYWQQLREYFFSLHLIDEDGEPAADVHVQVAGPDNQLLTVFTDESLGHNGGVGVTDENGWVKLSVPYQESYTVSAYDTYYNLAAQKTLTLYDIENEAQITLQLKEPYDLNNGQQYCNDVCHSFIGGLWITGLNLFYRLFKVKYVCCYDMYAAHGDRLVYASNSSGTSIGPAS